MLKFLHLADLHLGAAPAFLGDLAQDRALDYLDAFERAIDYAVEPSGVWVLEIKNFSGEYRNIGEQWEYRVGNRWKLHKKSPSRQAQNNAARLGNFLKADGIQQWVTAAVVWANQESPLTVENPTVAVWPLEHLPDELGNVWQDEKVTIAIRTRIVEKLTKLCQSQA